MEFQVNRANWIMVLSVGIGFLGFCGCEKKEDAPKPATSHSSSQAKAPAAASDAWPAGLLLKEEPAGAKDILDTKQSAKECDEVVIRGRVGGRKDPFVEGRAVMTIADAKLKPCNENSMDACPTPWDYCCDTPETLIAHTVTIQVVGSDGKPVKNALKGFGGIEPLKTVILRGNVLQKTPDGKIMVINAAGIYVKGA